VDYPRFAKAICHWLEYKRLAGFGSLLGEALLTLAVAEYLIGEGFNLQAERDLRSIAEDDRIPAGYFNYDLVANADKTSLILELKFLKPPRNESASTSTSRERLIDDIFRLASIPNTEYERLLIVGRKATVRLYESFSKLCNGEKIHISKSREADESVIGSEKTIPDGDGWKFCDIRPWGCQIHTLADETLGDTSLAIFQVIRLPPE